MNINSLIKSILTTIAFVYLGGIAINSIYPLFILIVLYFLFCKIKVEKNLSIAIFSAIFGLFAVLSLFQINVYQEQLEQLKLFNKVLKIGFVFAGTYFFVSALMSYLFGRFDKLSIKGKSKISPTLILVISFIALVIIYIPVWLMEYPSNINPDNINQIKQILSGSYTNHHPFLHTMWLKVLMSFGNDINTRVGIAALIQLIINALVFSLILRTIYTKTNSFKLTLICFLFYSLMSFNAFYSITLIKDVTHATTSCLLLLVIICYFDEKNSRKKNLYLLLIVIISILFCLFRTNGYYAFVLLMVATIYYSLKNKDRKLLIGILASFVLATLIKGPLYDSLGVKHASYVESLSIPLQQVSLVIKNGKYISPEQHALLSKIIDVSKISESYDQFLSNPIKNLVNDYGNVSYLENHKFEYLKLWLEIGLKNPIEYIRAFVDQTSTLFSPHHYGTSFFWEISNNDLGIVANPLVIGSNTSEVLHNLAYYQHNIPIFGCFHYPAISTWIMLVLLAYGFRNKNDRLILLISPLLGIFLTLLISCPYNICFRYYYAVVVCVPIIVLYSIIERNINE